MEHETDPDVIAEFEDEEDSYDDESYDDESVSSGQSSSSFEMID